MMTRSFHRRNLPHLYYNEGQYFITYRLANSILGSLSEEIGAKFGCPKNRHTEDELLVKCYSSLPDESGQVNNLLQLPEIAEIVRGTIIYPEGKDYKLICYCIMPDHVHLVFELLPQNKGISKIMQSVKRISARESNKILNREGKFWQDESYDRLIRDERELYFTVKYVLLNPVQAGLTDNWQDWKYTYCHPEYLVI
jgi:REP element-mobilizing transposase RayT